MCIKTHGMSFALYQCINVDRILTVIENNTKGRNIMVKHTIIQHLT